MKLNRLGQTLVIQTDSSIPNNITTPGMTLINNSNIVLIVLLLLLFR